MKQIIYILTLLVLASCGQPRSEQKIKTDTDSTTTAKNVKVPQNSTEEIQSEEDYRKQSLSGFEKATLYKLTDTISADFNGDGIIDKAFYKKENETSGIIIKHGKTNEEVRIGFGKPFSHMTEFNWVDYWGLVEDRETSETTFTEDGDVLGSKEIKLQNPSIALGADEVGGGLITFINGKYVWIHQTC
ncbi:MAG: hypothetical protein V4548_02535 [Bacteroidota bacterium]